MQHYIDVCAEHHVPCILELVHVLEQLEGGDATKEASEGGRRGDVTLDLSPTVGPLQLLENADYDAITNALRLSQLVEDCPPSGRLLLGAVDVTCFIEALRRANADPHTTLRRTMTQIILSGTDDGVPSASQLASLLVEWRKHAAVGRRASSPLSTTPREPSAGEHHPHGAARGAGTFGKRDSTSAQQQRAHTTHAEQPPNASTVDLVGLRGCRGQRAMETCLTALLEVMSVPLGVTLGLDLPRRSPSPFSTSDSELHVVNALAKNNSKSFALDLACTLFPKQRPSRVECLSSLRDLWTNHSLRHLSIAYTDINFVDALGGNTMSFLAGAFAYLETLSLRGNPNAFGTMAKSPGAAAQWFQNISNYFAVNATDKATGPVSTASVAVAAPPRGLAAPLSSSPPSTASAVWFVRRLDVSRMGLRDDAAAVLAELIRTQPILEVLVARRNFFGCAGFSYIADSLLSPGCGLKELFLGWQRPPALSPPLQGSHPSDGVVLLQAEGTRSDSGNSADSSAVVKIFNVHGSVPSLYHHHHRKPPTATAAPTGFQQSGAGTSASDSGAQSYHNAAATILVALGGNQSLRVCDLTGLPLDEPPPIEEKQLPVAPDGPSGNGYHGSPFIILNALSDLILNTKTLSTLHLTFPLVVQTPMRRELKRNAVLPSGPPPTHHRPRESGGAGSIVSPTKALFSVPRTSGPLDHFMQPPMRFTSAPSLPQFPSAGIAAAGNTATTTHGLHAGKSSTQGAGPGRSSAGPLNTHGGGSESGVSSSFRLAPGMAFEEFLLAVNTHRELKSLYVINVVDGCDDTELAPLEKLVARPRPAAKSRFQIVRQQHPHHVSQPSHPLGTAPASAGTSRQPSPGTTAAAAAHEGAHVVHAGQGTDQSVPQPTPAPQQQALLLTSISIVEDATLARNTAAIQQQRPQGTHVDRGTVASAGPSSGVVNGGAGRGNLQQKTAAIPRLGSAPRSGSAGKQARDRDRLNPSAAPPLSSPRPLPTPRKLSIPHAKTPTHSPSRVSALLCEAAHHAGEYLALTADQFARIVAKKSDMFASCCAEVYAHATEKALQSVELSRVVLREQERAFRDAVIASGKANASEVALLRRELQETESELRISRVELDAVKERLETLREAHEKELVQQREVMLRSQLQQETRRIRNSSERRPSSPSPDAAAAPSLEVQAITTAAGVEAVQRQTKEDQVRAAADVTPTSARLASGSGSAKVVNPLVNLVAATAPSVEVQAITTAAGVEAVQRQTKEDQVRAAADVTPTSARLANGPTSLATIGVGTLVDVSPSEKEVPMPLPPSLVTPHPTHVNGSTVGRTQQPGETPPSYSSSMMTQQHASTVISRVSLMSFRDACATFPRLNLAMESLGVAEREEIVRMWTAGAAAARKDAASPASLRPASGRSGFSVVDPARLQLAAFLVQCQEQQLLATAPSGAGAAVSGVVQQRVAVALPIVPRAGSVSQQLSFTASPAAAPVENKQATPPHRPPQREVADSQPLPPSATGTSGTRATSTFVAGPIRFGRTQSATNPPTISSVLMTSNSPFEARGSTAGRSSTNLPTTTSSRQQHQQPEQTPPPARGAVTVSKGPTGVNVYTDPMRHTLQGSTAKGGPASKATTGPAATTNAPRVTVITPRGASGSQQLSTAPTPMTPPSTTTSAGSEYARRKSSPVVPLAPPPKIDGAAMRRRSEIIKRLDADVAKTSGTAAISQSHADGVDYAGYSPGAGAHGRKSRSQQQPSHHLRAQSVDDVPTESVQFEEELQSSVDFESEGDTNLDLLDDDDDGPGTDDCRFQNKAPAASRRTSTGGGGGRKQGQPVAPTGGGVGARRATQSWGDVFPSGDDASEDYCVRQTTGTDSQARDTSIHFDEVLSDGCNAAKRSPLSPTADLSMSSSLDFEEEAVENLSMARQQQDHQEDAEGAAGSPDAVRGAHRSPPSSKRRSRSRSAVAPSHAPPFVDGSILNSPAARRVAETAILPEDATVTQKQREHLRLKLLPLTVAELRERFPAFRAVLESMTMDEYASFITSWNLRFRHGQAKRQEELLELLLCCSYNGMFE